MDIKIKNAKIWNAGNSWVATIPADYINNGLIDLNKKYDIILSEVRSDD